MKLTAIILDDEKGACQVLNSMLDEYCPEIEVQLVTQDPFLALEEIPKIKPNILFLDINMPKMSGFEFVDNLKNFDGKIIFTTAYDQYAIQAFKYAAFDYLLKPIHVEHLEETMKRLLKSTPFIENNNSIRDLLNYVENDHSINNSTLAIHQNGDLKFIQKEEVYYLEAAGNYTTIYCEKARYVTSKTLKDYESMLDETTFLRVHKSYIVNMKKTEKYTAKDHGKLVLTNGVQVPISRRKRNILNQFSG